jgi:hypothetical protein
MRDEKLAGSMEDFGITSSRPNAGPISPDTRKLIS